MQTLDSTWSYRTSFIYSGLKLTLVGFVWRHELQYSLQFKIFIVQCRSWIYLWSDHNEQGLKERESTVWIHTWYHDTVIPYGRKLSKEKTSTNFTVLWLFAKVFSPKFGGMASFGTAKASNQQKFSSRKLYFSSIRESFLSWKFPSIWYLRMTTALIHVRSHVTKLTSAEIIKLPDCFCENLYSAQTRMTRDTSIIREFLWK